MTASPGCRPVRLLGPAGALVGASLLFGSIGFADSSFEEGTSSGDVHKGRMYVPLHWAASVAPETLSPPVPGDCEGTVDLTMKWDEEEDYVKVRLKGKNVLTPHPTVLRTPGVDFFPNPFWPEQEDIVGGRYQFWIVSPAEAINLYYDPSNGNLLGSEHDFPAPPAGSITIPVPGIKAIPSQFFQPKPNGDLDVEIEWSYSALTRLDLPSLSHLFVTFPPHNLCGNNQFRYDLSTTRGYLSQPRPAAEARPFSAYFENGMIFQITIEPPVPYTNPPLDTQIATYNNATGIAGLIPRGYAFDIDAFFMNLAPPIKPSPVAGQCVSYFSGVHTKNLNFCGP
jgi:hypothetical protein